MITKDANFMVNRLVLSTETLFEGVYGCGDCLSSIVGLIEIMRRDEMIVFHHPRQESAHFQSNACVVAITSHFNESNQRLRLLFFVDRIVIVRKHTY